MIDYCQASYTPREELYNRIAKLQERLCSAGIQAAMIVQKADLFYFSGTCQDAHLLIPAQGEPLLMVRKSFERALKESALKKIIAIKNFKEICSNIKGIIDDKGRIGLEMDVLPVKQFFIYKEMLEHLELVDVSGYIQESRMVKSLYEIEYLKESACLASETFNNIPNHIKEGMTELDLACKIALFLRERGSQVNLRIRAFNQEPSIHVLSGWNAAYPGSFNGPTVGTGLNPCYPQGAGYKKIGRNEPILIDFATVLNGYAVDYTRIFSIGPLSDKLVDAYNTALKIKHRLIKETKPGCDGKKLYDIALSIVKESGYAAHFMGYGNGVSFIGHGIGLELDEWPVIAEKINIVLQQGMVFALEPKFVFPDEGAVGIEDTFIVTQSGLEQLTGLDDSIQIL